MRSLLCASRNNDLLRFEFLSSHLAGLRPAGSHCENSGKSDDTCASARSDRAKSAVFRDRSANAGVVARYFSPCLIFWCFWIKPKAQEKSERRKISRSILWENPDLLFGNFLQENLYHLLSPKGGAKSVRRAKKSGNGRRLAPKTLRGRARARVFDGASAARSSSRFFAMRRQLCALRNGDLFRFEFFSSHLAGLRPAGMHCENSGSSDGIGASARSGCTKQRSLLCAARNEDYSFH